MSSTPTNFCLVSTDAELQEALAQCGPGFTLQIAPGTYRHPLHLTQGGSDDRPLRLQAVEDGTVVFNGATPVKEWQMVGPNRWCTPFALTSEQRLEKHFGRITLPLQVWIDDRRLTQVASLATLESGSFVWMDGLLTLQLADDDSPYFSSIEVAQHATMFKVAASHVEVRGISVTRCAGSVQVAGCEFLGDHNLIELCEFSECSAGLGVRFEGDHLRIRRNRIHHNGQIGFVLLAEHSVFEENHVHDNDVRRFCGHPESEMHVWECGGGKVAYTRHTLFRANRFIDNRYGPGLWLDIDNYHNRIDGNFFSNNGHSSIMIEISRENIVCNNIIMDTVENNYAAAGVLVQLSSRTLIYHNLFLRSEGCGVHLRWHVRDRDIHPYEPADPEAFAAEHGFRQEDWMAPDGQYPVSENDIRNNVFVDCRRGAIQIDGHAEHTRANTSDYNFFWNSHNLHPMAGGHRLLEWQQQTGLDPHSYYEKEMHYGPLLQAPETGDVSPHPDSPLAAWRIPAIPEITQDFLGKSRPENVTAGPYEFGE